MTTLTTTIRNRALLGTVCLLVVASCAGSLTGMSVVSGEGDGQTALLQSVTVAVDDTAGDAGSDVRLDPAPADEVPPPADVDGLASAPEPAVTEAPTGDTDAPGAIEEPARDVAQDVEEAEQPAADVTTDVQEAADEAVTNVQASAGPTGDVSADVEQTDDVAADVQATEQPADDATARELAAAIEGPADDVLLPSGVVSHDIAIRGGATRDGAARDDADSRSQLGGAPEVTLPPVSATTPRVRLDGTPAPGADPTAIATALDGVTLATRIHLGQVAVDGEQGAETISVAVIDPATFRPMTPQVTADAVDVWRRITEGDAAFTHDVGTRLGLELGSRVPAGGAGETLRVGAFASNGAPPVADVIMSAETARRLGVVGRPALLVATADDTDLAALAQQLSEATGMAADVIAQPQERRAFLTGAEASSAFEPFTYTSLGDGMIAIDPEWVRANIVSAEVPIFRGHVTCHKALIPQLRGALQEVLDSGLADEIDPSQYGGCWVPRHILFNPNRGISMHAWGLAVDFNVRGNEYGNRNPQMHPGIVEIFERWGFAWGGYWSTPDGMHFELNALLQDEVP